MAPPNRPADLPKSTNDTTYFSSMLESNSRKQSQRIIETKFINSITYKQIKDFYFDFILSFEV